MTKSKGVKTEKSILDVRSSGVLLHPTSMPGKYGIGDLGSEALRFVDFLVESGQTFWLTLPLGPTLEDEYHCPYSAYSAFAGNWLLVSPERLLEEGYCSKADVAEYERKVRTKKLDRVDFRKVSKAKEQLLLAAFGATHGGQTIRRKLDRFIETHDWVHDYALFSALHRRIGKPRAQWDVELRVKDPRTAGMLAAELKDEIQFEIFCQFLFFEQWATVKKYANEHGISIFGDLPFYIADDSADVWAYSKFFALNPKDKRAALVSGVPPDLFSKTGQLWNHPIYNWKAMEKDKFSWWVQRMQTTLELVDVVRIDHFRAFAAYWGVKGGSKTAINGKWYPCPGRELFETFRKKFGSLPIVAEDLGIITKDVTDLRDDFGLMGTRVLQFGLASRFPRKNVHMPFNIPEANVTFCGTHDNDTALGWLKKLKAPARRKVMDFVGNPPAEEFTRAFIKLAMSTASRVVINPMQDLPGLGTNARMNMPGVQSWSNWGWRYTSVPMDVTGWLKGVTELYSRDPLIEEPKK